MPCMVMPKKQEMDKPNKVQLRMVIDYRQLNITGAKTTVFSDHKPLKNFFEGGMNVAKLDRWSLELQEFDISLEFI